MRTGLVLGAGGILGSAWTTGTLVALQARIGRPLGELDLLVGTSAGSVVGAALRCGLTVDDLVEHQRSHMRDVDRESGDGRPPVPWPWIGSPRLVAAMLTRPRSLNPVIAASALLPAGRARMESLVATVGTLQARIGVTADGWVPGKPLWVVAVDWDSGRRVVFGRAGGPPSSVADAVLASCAIPGWIAPQEIGGRRYVDGGMASTTSLGLLARAGAPELDEVYVLAPMASHAYDAPRDPLTCVERAVRRVLTRWLDAEVRAVRAAGIRVTVLTPGPADLEAIGGNLMDPRRRERVLDTALRTPAVETPRAA